MKLKDLSAPGSYMISMVSGDETEYSIDPACTVQLVVN